MKENDNFLIKQNNKEELAEVGAVLSGPEVTGVKAKRLPAAKKEQIRKGHLI